MALLPAEMPRDRNGTRGLQICAGNYAALTASALEHSRTAQAYAPAKRPAAGQTNGWAPQEAKKLRIFNSE